MMKAGSNELITAAAFAIATWVVHRRAIQRQARAATDARAAAAALAEAKAKAARPWHELTIVLNSSMTLAAKAWGSPEAPVKVLALHGWMDNAASFDLLAPLLLAQKMHVIAVDLPGHGLSNHRPDGTVYHFVDYAADVIAALDVLGWDKCVLLGHSLGGGVAVIASTALASRVSHVIMIDSLGPMPTREAEMPAQFAKAIAVHAAGHRDAVVFPTLDAAAQRASEGISKMPVEASRVMVERGTRPVEGGYVWRTDATLREPSRLSMSPAQAMAFAGAVQCPVLLITTRDGLFQRLTPEQLAERARGFAPLTHVQLDSGGHHVHLVTPSVIAEHVVTFLRS